MKRWIVYIKERCPLMSYLLLSLGLGLSPQVLSGAGTEVYTALWSAWLILVFFVVLRLMDEVKDYKKDQVAHPDRPLPRGLIKPDEAKTAVHIGLWLMVGLTGITWYLFGITAGLLYGATSVYLYLMYREFFCGSWLEKKPLLYATSHQAILFLLCATAAACADGAGRLDAFDRLLIPRAGFFLASLQVFPAFFAYEIGRKMSPDAHPILRYYRQTHGLLGSRLVLSVLMAAAALGLFYGARNALFISELGLYFWTLLGAAGITLVLLTTWLAGDQRSKWIGHATTFNLLIAIYAPVVAFFSF